MHDYFDILGLARNARPAEVRRACRGRVRSTHPDIRDGDAAVRPGAARPAGAPRTPEFSDAAIDFLDVSVLVDRMQAAFFRRPPGQPVDERRQS